MIKAVFFDLDGTLLPMDQRLFVKAYFGGLAEKLAPYGYDPKEIVSAVYAGVEAMINNDGNMNNEKVFWKRFSEILGEKVYDHISVFDDYYKNEFQMVKNVCGFNGYAKVVIEKVKSLGLRVVLATNPLFPRIATQSRIRWAGLEPDEFEEYTTYEDYSFCKPSLAYYESILKKLNLHPTECVMIGNDVAEDMVAENLGMKVFLLKDCLINTNNEDISKFEQGGFDELLKFIDSLNRK